MSLVAWGVVWGWVVVGCLLWCGVGEGEGKRPELVESSVWFSPNATLVNVNFDLAIIQMDFDQPLYTNGHSFLCAESQYPCPSLPCKPCDWSSQEPTGCDDTECCGPAQEGDMQGAQEWCKKEDQPEYLTLKIGETSKRITLEEGDSMYVRFFVPEEYYCRPFNIIPRPYYGTTTSSWSTKVAFPSFSTLSGWRDGGNSRTFGFGQNSILVCPNTTLHPEYNVGTYSGLIYALTATSFEIDIAMSPMEYPLPPPPTAISCDDVPQEVIDYGGRWDPVVCVEDGKSATFTLDDVSVGNQQVSVILPIPQGCHTISFYTGAEIPTSLISSNTLMCLPTQTNAPRELNNAAYFRNSVEGEALVLSACFEEEVTYLFCSIRLYRPEPVHFSFSTVAPVLRKSITDIPDASLAYMDGLQNAWAVSFGKEKYPCIGFYAGCFDWVLTPSDDTIFLFPPPASPGFDIEQTFEDLQEFYRDSGLQEIKENRLSLVVVFQAGTVTPIEKNLTSLSIAITAVTNKDGETVNLPGGGIDVNPESQKHYSTSNYIPHIPLSEIPEFVFPPCDTNKYEIYKGIVTDRLDEVGTKNSLDDVLSLKYSLDVMNEALLARTCTDQVAANLDTFVQEVTIRNSVECLYEFGTFQYWFEPCCNPFLSLTTCCIPFDYNKTETPYGTDVSDCGESQCAQSYYEELSFSFNHLVDQYLGCSSGELNPIASLTALTVQILEEQYIACLNVVGYGGLYRGIDCQVDSDCAPWLGICENGMCILPPLDEVEDEFLECYIEKMPSSLESYIKRTVLPPSVTDAPRNSSEFYDALKQAATTKDCVNPSNPLAINLRTRYQTEPLDYACVAEFYGLQWPEQLEEAIEMCPGDTCLRSFGCLVNASSCSYLICSQVKRDYIIATEESCPSDEECSVDVDDDCEGSYCVYCPENGELPCQTIPNFTNEDDCLNAVACELPDGTIDFTLTEEECRERDQTCTTDCAGESCESIYFLDGACFVPSISSESECSMYSSTHDTTTDWYENELCTLIDISEETDCAQLPSTEWRTCQQNELSSCNVSVSKEQEFLGCYVSLWHKCPNKEECESSGRCSDRDFYSRVSYNPLKVQYGACVGSGEFVAERLPNCGNSALYAFSKVACVSTTIDDPDDCVAIIPFYIARWVEPALTQQECESIQPGRGGCQLYEMFDILLWIFNEEECSCQGGQLMNAWEWIPGIWYAGVPRKLQWIEAEKKRVYEYKDALSFIMLADWILESTEEQFLYPIQSQIICESQSITNPVFTLVCDCLADGGSECYEVGEQDREVQMGLSEVCEGETTFVKDPSAQVEFGKNSVSYLCSFLNISIIYQNWFAAPFVPPPLSFKWQDQRQKGVVVNKNDATVGEVLGDGLVLSFYTPSIIETFFVCLRLTDTSSSFDVPDIGITYADSDVINPLGLKTVKLQDRGTDGRWYCSAFNFQEAPSKDEGVVRLFPINRLENYEDEDDEYTDKTTRALCYTLGAFYCLIGVMCIIGLILYLQRAYVTRRGKFSLPNISMSLFLILCVFRAVFMFLYPQGTFELQPLSYFVIFEIPTFLLFSVLIFMIYAFKRMVYKKGFFPGNPTPILAIGWTLVWGMWLVVTVVYSEVILDGSNGSSPCEGRVEVSYDEEQDSTRKLAIAYQSVIIVVTLLLTTIFFYYTYLMYGSMKHKTKGIKQFVIVVGGTFNVAFAIRTVLFLIMLAVDFASSIYLFCTLFITEILLMMFLLIQFNIRYFKAFASVVSDSKASNQTKSNTASGTMAHSYLPSEIHDPK